MYEWSCYKVKYGKTQMFLFRWPTWNERKLVTRKIKQIMFLTTKTTDISYQY